ncbi:MAG: protein kinase [Deltaproteobacteria bacterium]|nr:protein kinase [Deltaproteobacteria bacterium]
MADDSLHETLPADAKATMPAVAESAVHAVRQGDVLGGGFILERLLGRGGMGAVFEAIDRGLQRKVAIKVPLGEEDARLLIAEAQALGAIRHPGIVSVHHLGQHEGMPFLVMERLHGTPLDRMLSRRLIQGIAIEIDEALDIVERLAETLAFLHDCGVAHFDVKPANVIVTGNRAVLVDFGLVSPEYATEPTRTITGTPAYLAPERIRCEVVRGEAHLCDVYSLGATLWELLTGETPFEAGARDTASLLHRQVNATLRDPREARVDIPAEVVGLLHDMLEKEPYSRLSMQEVVWSIRELRRPVEDRSGMCVLVVEDDPDLSELVSLWIEGAYPAAEVLVESTAEAAMRVLNKRKVDLALLDLQLPGMSGVELCMYLRGARGDFPFPVAVMSASARQPDVALLRQMGVEAFLPKQADLEVRLRELLLGVSRRYHRSSRLPTT